MLNHDAVKQDVINYLTTQYGFNFESMPPHRVFALTGLDISAIAPNIETSAAPYQRIYTVDTAQGINGDITVLGGYEQNIDNQPTLSLILDGITSAVINMLQTSATLDDLADVEIINAQDGQSLVFNAIDNMWRNVNISAGSSTISGAVVSIFGRQGIVIAVSGDYNSSQITNASTIVVSDNVTEALDFLNNKISLSSASSLAAANSYTNTAITSAFSERDIFTTAPLSGGGSLSADKTIILLYDTNSLAVSGDGNLYVKDDGHFHNHSNLTNLSADDHIQYIRRDGSKQLTANWEAGAFNISAARFGSTIAAGTSPLTVLSDTLVTNLNADKLDGLHASDLSLSGHNHGTGTANYLTKFTDTLGHISNSIIFESAGNAVILSGNIGVGKAPGSWNVGYKAIEFGQTDIMAGTATTDIYVNSNARYTTNWDYIVNGPAASLRVYNGTLTFQSMVSGTAGGSGTMVERFTITNVGDINIPAAALMNFGTASQAGQIYYDSGASTFFVRGYLTNTLKLLTGNSGNILIEAGSAGDIELTTAGVGIIKLNTNTQVVTDIYTVAYTTWSVTADVPAGTDPSYTISSSKYKRVGNIVHFWINLLNTTGGTAGSGTGVININLPINPIANIADNNSAIGAGTVRNGTTYYPVVVRTASTGYIKLESYGTDLTGNHQNDANNRHITVFGTYVAA